MAKTKRQVKNHKYLVCAIYRISTGSITRVKYVGVVLASSSPSAITKAKKKHKTNGEIPDKYVASRIFGSFQTTPSGRTFTCEELLSINKGRQ